jgi:hypothetical protein
MHFGGEMSDGLFRAFFWPYWLKMRDKLDGSHALVVEAYPPSKLLTDGDGPNARIRVDVGQTGFFAGREFRAFKEFNLVGGTSLVLKVESPVDFILFGASLILVEGEIRAESLTGGAEDGSFSEVIPVYGRNGMTDRPFPYYTSQIVVTAGGTLTGGTLRDVLLNKTSGNSNFASTVGSEQSDERGLPPGTYYIKLTATGTSRGLFNLRWEERP